MKWKPIYAASEREITPWEWVTSSEKELRWQGDQWPGLRVEELTLSLIQVFKYLMHWDKEGSPLNEIECLLENLLPRVWCNLTVAKQPGCYSSMAPQSPFITPLKCFSVVLDLLLITASFKEGKEKGGTRRRKSKGGVCNCVYWFNHTEGQTFVVVLYFSAQQIFFAVNWWLYLWDNRKNKKH